MSFDLVSSCFVQTALDGFSIRKAGSASMAMLNPSDFSNIVETGRFHNGASLPSATMSALDAASSQRWPPQKYRPRFNLQSFTEIKGEEEVSFCLLHLIFLFNIWLQGILHPLKCMHLPL